MKGKKIVTHFVPSNKIQWCIDQHKNTNHWYDQYLPYEFHLRMVVQAANDYLHLYEANCEGDVDSCIEDILLACWGHDLIEDTRTSYNDVEKVLGRVTANIVYAVTNEKGKNRKERANKKYYDGIRKTEGAVFVKLCDRIANVQYSKMTKSSMFDKYKQENNHFITELGWFGDVTHPYYDMFADLQSLFQN
jgi:(p)ppGpp synthase/HD superfamily hydrolase